MLSRGKIITAKVFIGIICVILILGIVFMSVIISIFNTPHRRDDDKFYITYEYLPNVCGDDCIYISENFFVENNIIIPSKIEFEDIDGLINTSYVNGAFYYGRGNELGYIFATSRRDNIIPNGGRIIVSCNSKNMEKITDKQTYGGYDYGVILQNYADQSDNSILTMQRMYIVNAKRNANTSKECQLKFRIVIAHSKDILAEEYTQICDDMFYSLLDNLVYRNI